MDLVKREESVEGRSHVIVDTRRCKVINYDNTKWHCFFKLLLLCFFIRNLPKKSALKNVADLCQRADARCEKCVCWPRSK